MKKVSIIFAGTLLLSACTVPSKHDDRALESYTTAHQQLPPEEPYSRTAWVQPPTPLPVNLEGRAWESQDAPLLAPPSNPAQPVTSPKLPTARTSRKY